MKTTNKKTIKPVTKMKEGGAKKCPPGYCPSGGSGAGGGCVWCGNAKLAGKILSAGFTAFGNKLFKDASKKSAEKRAEKEAEKKETNNIMNTIKKANIKKKGGAVKSNKKK